MFAKTGNYKQKGEDDMVDLHEESLQDFIVSWS